MASPGWKLRRRREGCQHALAERFDPWLLLRSTRWTYGPSGGTALAPTAYIQRTNATGGLAPGQRCDSSGSGRLMGVDYTATYNFYREYMY